jgi:hypothetical protein
VAYVLHGKAVPHIIIKTFYVYKYTRANLLMHINIVIGGRIIQENILEAQAYFIGIGYYKVVKIKGHSGN